MKVVVLLAVVAVASALEWEEWKSVRNAVFHGKVYSTQLEDLKRRTIWEASQQYVDSHNANADKFGFTLEMNEFADLEDNEFIELYNGYNMEERTNSTNKVFTGTPDFVPLANVDWRDMGAVTEVKNQGQCGSCWSFSATGSLEGQHFLKTKQLVSLSEQNLIDCSTREGNHGCKGGLMDNAFRYIRSNDGIDTEESYPYQAHDELCRFRRNDVGATLRSYRDILRGSERALAEAIQTVGPISVAMDASKRSFRLYRSGIYSDPTCSSTKLDHGVLAVGLGEDYYIVKNSWGPSWGDRGFFKLARDRDNMCGIATQASYPEV